MSNLQLNSSYESFAQELIQQIPGPAQVNPALQDAERSGWMSMKRVTHAPPVDAKQRTDAATSTHVKARMTGRHLLGSGRRRRYLIRTHISYHPYCEWEPFKKEQIYTFTEMYGFSRLASGGCQQTRDYKKVGSYSTVTGRSKQHMVDKQTVFHDQEFEHIQAKPEEWDGYNCRGRSIDPTTLHLRYQAAAPAVLIDTTRPVGQTANAKVAVTIHAEDASRHHAAATESSLSKPGESNVVSQTSEAAIVLNTKAPKKTEAVKTEALDQIIPISTKARDQIAEPADSSITGIPA